MKQHPSGSRRRVMLAPRMWLALLLIALGGGFGDLAHAGHAPSVFYWVRNEANTDRFSTPEAAGRTSLDRFNASHGSNPGYLWVYDHISSLQGQGAGYTYTYWQVWYLDVRPSGTTGPYVAETVEQEFSCDLTPLLGPNIPSDSIGLPKSFTMNPTLYAAGCPVPQLDLDKNLCKANCEGDPINSGTGDSYQEETDYLGSGSAPSSFVRHYNSLGFSDSLLTASRSLGAGWRDNYDRVIKVFSTATVSSAAVLRPEGRILWFTLSGGVGHRTRMWRIGSFNC